MFKRPPAVKTSAPVRSSDVRRLRDEVQQAFALPQDRVKKLVPDGTLAAKATTHLDEHCTLYLAPTSTDCRLFRVGKGTDGYLVPTCYACDLVPDLLPVLETAPQVVDHLVSGSALFAAGVSARSLAALPNAIQPGALVAVVVAQDPPSRRVVAVGHLGATKSDLIRMQQSDGEKKGKAVVTLHARGDFLWNAGSGIDAPLPPSSRGSASPALAGADALAADLASSLDTPAAEPSPSASSSAPTAELTPAEVDSALFTALLVALSTTLPSASLPLPASLLYSSHILPCRPSSGPGAAAEVKKSTFKKLDRFVRAAAKKGWIATKEVKGEIVVVAINAAHPDVESVRGYRTQGMEERKEARREKAAEGGGAGAESVEGKGGAGAGEVRELWKLSGESVKELIRSVEHERPPTDLYPTSLLSSLLRTFTTTHSLSHPSQRSLLLLTPSAHPSPPSLSPAQTQAIDLLSRVVLRKGERAEEVGRERGAPGCVGREEALRRVLAGCTAYWGYSRKGAGEEVIKKGSPPTIRVAIKNVGKRQVTLVSGHEPWELFTSEELAEELKHRSASSTTIQPLAGSAKKGHTPKVEIMCQGTHDALVVKLLVARGVPRMYVEVDTSKSKK